MVKNLLAKEGDIRDAGSVLGLGRSSGGRHGNPLLPGESPRMEEPAGLQFIGSQTVRHD